MGIAVASYYYRTTHSDEPLRTQLAELARSKPRFGYRRLHVLLGRSGEQVNPRKDALTFFDLNCADNKNNKSGGLREWGRERRREFLCFVN
jgi:putative transposase